MEFRTLSKEEVEKGIEEYRKEEIHVVVIKDRETEAIYIDRIFDDVYEVADCMSDLELANFLEEADDVLSLVDEINDKLDYLRFDTYIINDRFSTFLNYKGGRDGYCQLHKYLVKNNIKTKEDYELTYWKDVNEFIKKVKGNK
jgi:hypothetical protein